MRAAITGPMRLGNSTALTTAAQAMPRRISSERARAASKMAPGCSTWGRAISGTV
ncbi:hypothetical protein D3C81_680250 [compost metagenome]